MTLPINQKAITQKALAEAKNHQFLEEKSKINKDENRLLSQNTSQTQDESHSYSLTEKLSSLHPQFYQAIKKATEKFSTLEKNEMVRIVSHLDADGISACSLMVKLLNFDNRRYSISVVPKLDQSMMRELQAESYKYYIFTDIGSGQLDLIARMLPDKKIFVLDHHQLNLEFNQEEHPHIVHINPQLFGIDGSSQISGSGVVYLFCQEIDKRMENYSYLAMIGALGDIQERVEGKEGQKGFSTLNSFILEVATRKKLIGLSQGVRFFGYQTKPIHKVLEYATDPFIPGVSGSESGAIQFLQQLGINPKKEGKWKRLIDLDKEESKKLAAGIIMRRVEEENPEDIFGNIYVLENEEEGLPTKDLKEFATLLNACGRLNKASLGIGACLGDQKIKKRAIAHLDNYRREIISTLKWFERNQKDPEVVIQKQGYVIIKARDKVRTTMIGTLASMLSKSNQFKEGTCIVGLADYLDGKTKVSMRRCGRDESVDLKKVIDRIVSLSGGESGGHKGAAGALIETDKEDEFVKAAEEVLGQLALEVKVE